MKVQFCLVAALVLWLGSFHEAESVTPANLLSTMRIVARLCGCPIKRNSQTVIDGFFGCYDQAPGKAQFVKCQTETNGGPLNTVAAAKQTCSNLTKLPGYSSCLEREFAAAGLNLDDAVSKLNVCQSAVLGIH